jgi:ribonucleoside-diphosphate reductase alpha chain
MDHLQMIAALQLCVENGISKTINLPSSASVQEVYQIFMDAIRLSLKGITVFRDGSLSEQALTVSAGCAGCGAVMALRRNECGGYVCATERGGCGFAVCEV